ncbi:MAG: transposase [Verrucomicrobiales bacterium]
MRHPRILGTGPLCYYHVLSRVIERRFIFDVPEREYFQKTMRAQEAFCGVRVLTWTCLSNHFHILVAVPDRGSAEVQAEIGCLLADDDAFLARVKCLYVGSALDEIQARLLAAREGGAKEEAKLAEIEAIKRPYLERMYDLSAFVGEIKQRISQWYNGKNERTGPLWEDRFKSVLVQGKQGVLATVAAYIDLNAVRAGIVQDPRQWRWCGYAEAAARGGPVRDLRDS